MHAPDSVRFATRLAVERVAAELGYLPDGRARALASGRSMMIGAILPTINNPVYAEFVHALQRRLSAQGYSLVVQAHEYDAAAEVGQLRALIGLGVDAVVVVGTDHDPALRNLLETAVLRHLFVWSIDSGDAERCIGFSNRDAMRAVAEHIVALGHRRIGVISGEPRGNERAVARLEGLAAALHAGGARSAAGHHPAVLDPRRTPRAVCTARGAWPAHCDPVHHRPCRRRSLGRGAGPGD